MIKLIQFARSGSAGALAVALALTVTGPAFAGEITGNGDPIEIQARSVCAFSGLNDNVPDPRDPGGLVQNYGQLVGQFGLINPQNLDPNAPFYQPIPGWACNPNIGHDLHSGE